MFELSLWKLMIIGAVALVVIGPDRLPEVARTAGRWFGRLQRYLAHVKADINREIEASEFQHVKQEFQTASQQIEQSINQVTHEAETEVRQLEQQVISDHAAPPETPIVGLTEIAPSEVANIAAPDITPDSSSNYQGRLDFEADTPAPEDSQHSSTPKA